MRFMLALGATVFATIFFVSVAPAEAQQETKFLGWASDGQAVVRDVSADEEMPLHCKPARLGRFDSEHAAPEHGCTPCKGKKECSVSPDPAFSATSPDGKVRVEQAKDHPGFLLLTLDGAAPKRVPLHATKKATIRTWFRPDSKAFVILIYDAEDRLYVVDLSTLPADKAAK